MVNNVTDILVLSTLAGLATGLGGLIVLFRRPGRKLFGFLMGLAAGIMITLSFTQLMAEALRISGVFFATSAFTVGALVMGILDFLLPHAHFSVTEKGVVDGRLLKSGLMIAIGITLHNFPEGMSVASGYSYIPRLGVVIAVAMAIHNVPEGIATSLPLYAGGASRRMAFGVALASGLAEPLGALVAAYFLQFFKEFVPFGLGFAAGVMVFITLDELIPVAQQNGHEHFMSFGVILGCIATFIMLAML